MLADLGPSETVDRAYDIVMTGWTAMPVRTNPLTAGPEQQLAEEAEAGRATRQKGHELTIEEMKRTDRLLTAGELADYLGVPGATLYAWRYRGQGPAGFRVGKHLRYRWSDVECWVRELMNESGQNYDNEAASSPQQGGQ